MDTPYKKLNIFRHWLGLDEADLQRLEPFRDIFIRRKDEFARHFHDYFMKIPEAKLIIEHEERPGYLLKAWAHWFDALFSKNLNEEFLGYLWRVGKRHVEVKLDKRFSNMGFSVVRQFCQELILSEIPSETATEVLRTVDKLIDFCLLVETNAYIETTARCDLEIIKGVADRVRNPVTVIGGNISRLMKNVDSKDAHSIYELILSQSTKLERTIRDIKTYTDVFDRESLPEKVFLECLLKEVIEGLLVRGKYISPRIEMNITHEASYILADQRDMKALFEHILENSLEALDEKNPLLSISASIKGVPPHILVVEIFNTGTPPREEDSGKLFSPFYSTKPGGTGFGLPIARQAARNNLGTIHLEPVKGEGTKVVITLPRYE